MFRRMIAFLAAGICVVVAGSAEVKVVSDNGFEVVHAREVDKDPSYTYGVFVKGVSKWWSGDHSFSGDASNLSIDARPGGCFCEELPGGGVRHLSVGYVDSGKMIRLLGGLGPLQEFPVSGALTVEFKPSGTGTTIEMIYRVSGQVDGGFQQWAPIVDQVLGEQFSRLEKYVNTGSPQ